MKEVYQITFKYTWNFLESFVAQIISRFCKIE